MRHRNCEGKGMKKKASLKPQQHMEKYKQRTHGALADAANGLLMKAIDC